MKDKFNLENQYQNYLKRCGIIEDKMQEVQQMEMRKAFMAGSGSVLLICRNDIPKLKGNEAIKALNDMLQQLVTFWEKATKAYNKTIN